MTEQVPIPQGFVPICYLNHAQTEDLIYGDQLAKGMVVCLEDTLMRPDPDRVETMHPLERDRLLECARWCRITQLRVHRSGDSGLVSFIGEYADGSKRARTYNTSYAWYVKKSSIPAVAA